MVPWLFTVSLLLGSLWVLIPAALALSVHKALQDKTLQRELDHYAGYAHQARYRLVPDIW